MGIPAISACSRPGCRELTKNLQNVSKPLSDSVAGPSKQARAQSLRFMEAFDYVVALKVFAAGSLVYGAVLFILIRFQRVFLFQSRLPISRTREGKEFAGAHFAMTTADGETLDAV